MARRLEQREHVVELEEPGEVQRALRAARGVGAGVQQQLDAARLPAEGGRAEGGLAAVVLPLGVRAALQQGGHGVRVLVVGGQDQQGVAGRVGQVHRQAGVDQRGELAGLALAGEVERVVQEVQLRPGQLAHPSDATSRDAVTPSSSGRAASAGSATWCWNSGPA